MKMIINKPLNKEEIKIHPGRAKKQNKTKTSRLQPHTQLRHNKESIK